MKTKDRKEENKIQENRIGYMDENKKQLYRKKFYIVSNPLDNYFHPKLHKRSWWPNGYFQVKRRYCYGETGLQYYYEKNNVEQLKDLNSEENTKKKEQKDFIKQFNEYEYARDNEYIITIEYCANCDDHGHITQHSSEMFKNLATNYQKIIQARFPFIRVILKPIDVDILKEEAYKLPPLPENGQSYHNVQYINDKFKPCRIGAFEIQLYSKSSGIQVIHSKLYTKQWPKVNTVLGKIVSCMPMFDLNLVIYDKEDYTEKEKMDGIQVNVYLVNNENIQEYIDNIEDDVGNVTNPGKRLETMKMTARMQKEGLYLNSLSNTNTRMQSAYTTNGSGRMMTFSARSNMKSAYRAHSTTGNAPSSSTARGGFKINCDLAQQKGKLIMRKFTQVEKEIESEDEEEKKEEVKEEEKKEEEKVNEEQPVTSEERKSRQESGKSQKSRQQSGKNQQMKSRQQTAKSKRTETNTIRESEENVNTKLSFTNLPYDTYIIETIENSNFTSSLTLLSFNSINRTFVKKQVPDPHDNNKPKEEITEENTKVTKYLGLYHQSKAILNIHLYTETEVAEPEKAKEGQMQVTTEKDTKPTTEQNKDPTNIEITPITSSSVTLTNINTSNKYSIIPNDRSIYEFKTEPGYYKIEIYDKEYESITKKINLERGLNAVNIRLTHERKCEINIKVVAYNFDEENEEEEGEKKDPFVPIQNAEVSIYKNSSDLLTEGITNKKGKMLFIADTNENSLSILVEKIGFYSAQRFFTRNRELQVNEETGHYIFNMTFVLLSEKAIMESQNIIFISYMNVNQKLFDFNMEFFENCKAKDRVLLKDSQEENGIIIAKFDYKKEDEENTNNETENEENLEEEDETNHYEEIVRLGMTYTFEKQSKEEQKEEGPLDIQEKIEYLNKIMCEGMIYTPNNSFYINIPNTIYEEPKVVEDTSITNPNEEMKESTEVKEEKKKGLYWDLGWLDIKNKMFYETSTFFELSQKPARELYFEEWIDFLQKLIDKKIYMNLFEFFNFQRSCLTETDRLLSRATFNNILSNMLMEEFNENKDKKENEDEQIEVKDISPFIISIMSLPIEDKDSIDNDNCISLRLLKKKITSNLKNFSCIPPSRNESKMI